MKEHVILEQYKQLYNDRAMSTQHQWQLISFGNTLLVGLLAAALTSKEPTVSLFLSGIAIPTCFLIFIAYRKYVYFENLASDTIEAIEKSIDGVLHVQYDTVPQKDRNLYYIVRYPKQGRPEQISMHTVMNFIFVIYNILSLIVFTYYAENFISLARLIPITVIILPVFYLFTDITQIKKSDIEF